MDEKPDAIRRQIARKRAEIAEDVASLQGHVQDRFQSVTDPSRIARGHPLASFGLMALLGALLALMAGRLVRHS